MNVAVATMADATATRMALCMTPPGSTRIAPRRERHVDAIVFGLGPFEKRKMFQCVYCSIGTPSYIWSTRSICVSRL